MALKQTGQDDHYGSNGHVDQSGVELQALRAGIGTVLKPKPERMDKLPLFWQVFGVVSIGTTAHMEGVILSQTSITLGTGASANSRLLAQTAVTLAGNAVVQPAP